MGITGAPGAGKSTLTSATVAAARARGERIAVLAIDPSSPFTGGALLGDRTRMNDHALDDGVFIRSMATRGHLGGLALATRRPSGCSTPSGFPWVLVETVGVGQVEVEVAGAADTTVVVVNPGWGDSVQANKAGLMEIADVFVVNKADRDGAVADGARPRGHARPDPRARRRRLAPARRLHGGHHRRGRRRRSGTRSARTASHLEATRRAGGAAASSACARSSLLVVEHRLRAEAEARLAGGDGDRRSRRTCSTAGSTRGPPPTASSATLDPRPFRRLARTSRVAGRSSE